MPDDGGVLAVRAVVPGLGRRGRRADPGQGHFEFAKGALIAVLGVVAFEILFVVLMFVGAGLR